MPSLLRLDDMSKGEVVLMPCGFGVIDEPQSTCVCHHEADREFYVLARRAFAIQLRRGWSVTRAQDGRFFVPELLAEPYFPMGQLSWVDYFAGVIEVAYQDDPVSAVIAAEVFVNTMEEQRASASV